jgi:hypothetical protein
MTLQQVDGEEVCATGMPGTAVVGHFCSIALAYIRRNALRLLLPTLYYCSKLTVKKHRRAQ